MMKFHSTVYHPTDIGTVDRFHHTKHQNETQLMFQQAADMDMVLPFTQTKQQKWT
jgi:hypothetical protein